MRENSKKQKFLNLLNEKSSATTAEVAQAIGATKTSEVYGTANAIRRDGHNLVSKKGVYSLGKAEHHPPAVAKPQVPKNIPANLPNGFNAELLATMSQQQIDDTLDMIHKAVFYKKAAEAQLEAAKVVAEIRRKFL